MSRWSPPMSFFTFRIDLAAAKSRLNAKSYKGEMRFDIKCAAVQ